jgi:hypothetical protein
MAMNRIQFQPGLSPPAFLAGFGIEAQSEAALEKERRPLGVANGGPLREKRQDRLSPAIS